MRILLISLEKGIMEHINKLNRVIGPLFIAKFVFISLKNIEIARIKALNSTALKKPERPYYRRYYKHEIAPIWCRSVPCVGAPSPGAK